MFTSTWTRNKTEDPFHDNGSQPEPHFQVPIGDTSHWQRPCTQQSRPQLPGFGSGNLEKFYVPRTCCFCFRSRFSTLSPMKGLDPPCTTALQRQGRRPSSRLWKPGMAVSDDRGPEKTRDLGHGQNNGVPLVQEPKCRDPSVRTLQKSLEPYKSPLSLAAPRLYRPCAPRSRNAQTLQSLHP